MTLVVGLGSSRGVRPDAVRTTLRLALRAALRAALPRTAPFDAAPPAPISAFATVERRRGEPGLLAVIAEHDAPLHCYPTVELDAVDVPNPSVSVRAYVGTRSVAEAAALLATRDLGGGELVVPKLRGEHVTVAVAALTRAPAPTLTISSACTACGACLLTCPQRALRPAPRRPVVLATQCTSCGECVEVCPTDAIALRETSPGSGAPEVGPAARTGPGSISGENPQHSRDSDLFGRG